MYHANYIPPWASELSQRLKQIEVRPLQKVLSSWIHVLDTSGFVQFFGFCRFSCR
jgi:hypothetical protein